MSDVGSSNGTNGPAPATSKSCTVAVVGETRTFKCPSTQTVLKQMYAVGLDLLPVGCRGGGCGVCRVKVLSGEYEVGRQSRLHVTEEDEERGLALSCRLFPRSDLVVEHDESPNAKVSPHAKRGPSFQWPGWSGANGTPAGSP